MEQGYFKRNFSNKRKRKVNWKIKGRRFRYRGYCFSSDEFKEKHFTWHEADSLVNVWIKTSTTSSA